MQKRQIIETREVIELKKTPLQLEDELRDIWRFGIEVVFDGPIEATPDLFRYQVVESKLKDPETGIYKAQFFMQIVFPNSEKVSQISGFKNHEYLRKSGSGFEQSLQTYFSCDL